MGTISILWSNWQEQNTYMVSRKKKFNKDLIRNVRKRTFRHMRPAKIRNSCTSAQSDQRLHCPHEESLQPWLSKMRPVKIQISLRKCAGWSESSLGADVRMYDFWLWGSLYIRDIRPIRIFRYSVTAVVKFIIHIILDVSKNHKVLKVHRSADQRTNSKYMGFVTPKKGP